ncbi:putative cytosol aminopeptidase [Sulfuriferula plumbiphila]|uniref:Probable cytosol aminopeptidase n=1 Tax=Sulfuriferula plumbiphila TaxID=171865 RepID=A0A512L413_9PROT|nr:leucyl aminopeptidase [Sulfuriferula plumbiphila]BBP05503.1 putative cytosol aminopeptidase [Sulfuriferula plumbiphila]GEP29200.1 putative cytosol aminopeptidase [Sulfuriferula plumbiphila]
MEFSIKSTSPEKQRAACVVVGVYESRKLSPAATQIDQQTAGYLTDILRHGDMDGRLGSTCLLHKVPGTLCERVLLVGLGRERDVGEKAYADASSAALKALAASGAADAAIYLIQTGVKGRDLAWNIEQLVIAAEASQYQPGKLKSKHDKSPSRLRKLTLCVSGPEQQASAEAALAQGMAIGAGMSLAKALGDLPGNVCTPTYLAEQAQALARSHKLKCEVLDKKDMEKLGMGSFLSVAKGSRQPPRLIVLQHNGGKKGDRPVVLVGKGITFDAGGISLKPAAEMDEMKYDMCGAASVLGTLRAAAEMKLPLNVVGVIPSCENLPDGDANKPGDIVTSMSGQTIEILNTDAEGRLILCDALTYSERFEPAAVIDIATLTGACVIALGHHASGMFSNHDGLAREIEHAAAAAQDRVWRLPLWDDYQQQLDSNFADMANIGGRAGGSITAACFLSRFTKKYDWAHLDIAGTAWKSGKDKGSTGRPVPLLVHFLVNRASRAK